MTPLRQCMFEDMQLRGLAPRTQDCYVQAVLRFARHYAKSPDLVTEDELRAYFLYLINEKHVAAGTLSIALSAIKFLFVHTLQRPWPVLDFIHPRKPRTLPAVLSVEEVHRLLSALRQPHHRVCLTTIYAAGLRLTEGVFLRIPRSTARACGRLPTGREWHGRVDLPRAVHRSGRAQQLTDRRGCA